MRARRPGLYVITALKRKYAQRLGEKPSPEREADMAHLAAVILMFEPGADLAAIQPVRPYKANRERWSRTAIDILKRANHPLRARELARLVMAAHDVDPDDHRRLLSISCGLQIVLGRLAEHGDIEVTGKPRRWAIAR